jgi:hypothetical protein
VRELFIAEGERSSGTDYQLTPLGLAIKVSVLILDAATEASERDVMARTRRIGVASHRDKREKLENAQ